MVTPPATGGSQSAHEALRGLGVGPRKSLGQHFLSDRSILRSILEAADLSPADLAVEVGPGLGHLTQELAQRVERVVAVELDAGLADALRGSLPASVQLVVADARAVDVCALVGGRSSYKLLGNLPYYAALPILRRFLESACPPSVAIVTVQKEVAQSMVAVPGDMSLVSVAIQTYGRPRIVRTIRPGAFYPPPKVTSAVVRIDVHPAPLVPQEQANAFFLVVRAGFSAPRKQLRNALALGLGVSTERATDLLKAAGIDPSRRAATVSLPEWRRLYEAVEGAR